MLSKCNVPDMKKSVKAERSLRLNRLRQLKMGDTTPSDTKCVKFMELYQEEKEPRGFNHPVVKLPVVRRSDGADTQQTMESDSDDYVNDYYVQITSNLANELAPNETKTFVSPTTYHMFIHTGSLLIICMSWTMMKTMTNPCLTTNQTTPKT